MTNVASALFMCGHQIGVLTSYPRALEPGWNQNFDITVEQILTQWEDINATTRGLYVTDKLQKFRPDLVVVNRFFAEDLCGFAPALKDYKVVEIVHNVCNYPNPVFRLFYSAYTASRRRTPPVYLACIFCLRPMCSMMFLSWITGSGWSSPTKEKASAHSIRSLTCRRAKGSLFFAVKFTLR